VLASEPFNTNWRLKMRPLVLLGLILVVLGIVALAIPTFTFFTTERVADVGFFKIDVSRPHTIVINPIVGGIALAAGIVLVLLGWRSAAS
jgi:UDP-N-acetylmuramyl pentapeptide phosphotransferase/UDP-N-acetylglucosamine-1-phosphate transferase